MGLIELRQGSAEGESREKYQPAIKLPIDLKPKFLVRGSSDEEFWFSKLHALADGASVPCAESQAEVFERVRRCLEDLALRPWESVRVATGLDVPRIAVFTHENVIKCLLLGPGLGSKPYGSFKLANLSVTVVRLEGNRPWRWSLIQKPDASD